MGAFLEPKDVPRAEALGAAFLTKPFELARMRALVPGAGGGTGRPGVGPGGRGRLTPSAQDFGGGTRADVQLARAAARRPRPARRSSGPCPSASSGTG